MKKGSKMPKEARKKMREHIFTEEHKAKLSIAHKGQKVWNKGKKLSPLTIAHRKKISKALKKRNISKEHKLEHRYFGELPFIRI